MTVEVCGVEQREDVCDSIVQGYQGYPVLVCWSPFFNKNETTLSVMLSAEFHFQSSGTSHDIFQSKSISSLDHVI